MNYLHCIAEILKSGAEMKLLETGEIEITKANLIPSDVMNAANDKYDEIELWYNSWAESTPVQITMRNIVMEVCGWTENKGIEQWLSTVEGQFLVIEEWMCILAKNGWTDVYDDYRKYENEESHKMAQQIYESAVAYAKSKKAV